MAYKDSEKGKLRRKQLRQKNITEVRAYYKNYEKINSEKIKEQRRLAHVKRLYKLNAEQYYQMIQQQNNLCAICHNPEICTNKNKDVRPLCIDHDHTTGKVRGLLCNSCNAMLGNANDSIDKLKAAINYLQFYEE